MKSGTNSIQHAAKKKRKSLLEKGVRYPGRDVNHFTETCAFMGLSREGEVPPFDRWQELVDEINSDSRRALISHEWICEADDEQARGFVESLGENTHVVITLRPLSGMLGSYWQQMVKTGVATLTFNDWLKKVLAAPPGTTQGSKFDKQSDQANIVSRWERVVGPDRLTVLIADKKRPTLISDGFEQLLALPPGFLVDDDADGTQSNRSLSVSEAELFRRLNVIFKKHEVPWVEYATAPRRGAVARVLKDQLPGSDQKIQLPEWAADVANSYSERMVTQLRESGATVVGDLDALSAPVSTAPDSQDPIDTISMDVAVEAIAGTVSASLGRGPFFGKRNPNHGLRIAGQQSGATSVPAGTPSLGQRVSDWGRRLAAKRG